MTLIQSLASEQEIDQYSSGSCHILAVALHRKLGWNIELRVDNDEPFWVDEEDADNFLPAVLHVYALDPQMRAWDVRGVRPYDDLTEEIDDAYSPSSQASDELRSECELLSYVGCWADEGEEEIDRPLHTYSNEDVEAAWEVAKRIFATIPGFIPPRTSPRNSP